MNRFEDYVRLVEHQRPNHLRTNPPGQTLLNALCSVQPARFNLHGVFASDVISALCCFTDDYTLKPPRSLYAVRRASELLRAFERQRSLIITDQLREALNIAKGNLFEATLALHTATRVLARGRDTRLSDVFVMSLEERLERGKAIAPFHPNDSIDGDPLGDTYHFWANVVGGLYAGSQRGAPVQAAFVAGMLYNGPWSMQTIREGVFGSRLFYGNHSRIDRLGLAVGKQLARSANHSQATLAPRSTAS